jgi:molybdate transport system ATP-binding protein
LSETILKLNKVTISYGTRTILKDLDWEVKKGEKWSLQGKNGAGKSTVLSIICADNPQSYRCDVTLFGHRRGSGESIWDIKKHIGFVSPEIFRSYRKPLPVENIIASGLYDTIGLYRKTQEEDIAKIDTWLKIFQIESLRGRNYLNLSDGEQRLILLVRAFVKNPALLILDEPFHGMDAKNRLKAKEIIELYCKQPDKTLIMVSHYTEDFPSCITNNLTLIKNN